MFYKGKTPKIMQPLNSLALAMVIVGAGLIAQPPDGSSIVNGLGEERLDFTAISGQTTFSTAPVFPRSNVVKVFRNGLLQRACATCDYTQTVVQGGTIRITFNPQPSGPVPAAGDYVTLFYYR
jgi:hypothetical protein